MKKILYENKKDVFSNWLNKYFIRKQSRYIWAQICYDWDTGNLLHVVFEKNSSNEKYIQWPIYMPDIPVTNIDFTSGTPTLDNGQLWDYKSWHRDALRCNLSSDPRTEPTSFWDWRLQTRPQGNATCDLDFFCKTVDKEFIGIEATEIYYVDSSADINQDVFEHFQRLLKLRKGNSHGFNLRQLRAQKKFVRLFKGRLFMLFHQILTDQQPYRLREDKCLLLEINDSNYKRIESIVAQPTNSVHESQATYFTGRTEEDPMVALKQGVLFASLDRILDRFLD